MQKVLQFLFIIQFIGILLYTSYAVSNEGWTLIQVFFGDLSDLTWAGQFNFDFLNYLVLSAIWIAWRQKFSPAGLFLGLLASVLGILFFAPYLLYLSASTNGNAKHFFLGKNS